jgi:Spx/MgsR family transcriptional regulator
MTTIYGLKNCDTCRKAQNWLKRFGIDYRFVDYRDERQSPETLVAWKDALGGWEAMVNKSSTTWRNLPPNRGQRRGVETAAEGISAADPASRGRARRRFGVAGIQR